MNSPENIQKIAFWLVPAQKQFYLFQELVNEIAIKFGGPRFNPHITLYAGIFPCDIHLKEILIELKIRMAGPIGLKPSRISFSEIFTKSCYLDFLPSNEIATIPEFIQEWLITPTDYCFSPHMSLFYGNLSPSDQIGIADSITIPEIILFDAIWAVLNPPSITEKGGVEAWRMICNVALALT